MPQRPIDYDALAASLGGSLATPTPPPARVDYDALASELGGALWTPPKPAPVRPPAGLSPAIEAAREQDRNPFGLIEPGTVDLYAQPKVPNPDGGTSTVFSFSANFDGQEVLLPMVMPDGRLLNEEDAIAEFQKTGRHLGVFRTPEGATAYAKQLHDDYAAGKYDRGRGAEAQMPSSRRSDAPIAERLLTIPGEPRTPYRQAPVPSHEPGRAPSIGKQTLNATVGSRAATLADEFTESAVQGAIAQPAEGVVATTTMLGITDPEALARIQSFNEAAFRKVEEFGSVLDNPAGTLGNPVWWARSGGQVFGSVAGLAGTAAVGGKAFAVLGESWLEGASVYSDAIKQGASPADAAAAAVATAVANAPFIAVTNTPLFDAPTKSRLVNAFVRSLSEGGQEAGQLAISDTAAQQTYDPQRTFPWKQAVDEALLGGVVGPVAGSVISGEAAQLAREGAAKARQVGSAAAARARDLGAQARELGAQVQDAYANREWTTRSIVPPPAASPASPGVNLPAPDADVPTPPDTAQVVSTLPNAVRVGSDQVDYDALAAELGGAPAAPVGELNQPAPPQNQPVTGEVPLTYTNPAIEADSDKSSGPPAVEAPPNEVSIDTPAGADSNPSAPAASAPSAPATPLARQPIDYGAAQRATAQFKSRLTKLTKAQDHQGVIALWREFEGWFDARGWSMPDDWRRWERAAEDAQYALDRQNGRGHFADPTRPLAPTTDPVTNQAPATNTSRDVSAPAKPAAEMSDDELAAAIMAQIEAEQAGGATARDVGASAESRPGPVVEVPPAPSVAPAAPAVNDALPHGATIRYNADRKSAEVKFPGKPPAPVLEALKKAGYKWAKTAKVWYRAMPNRTADEAQAHARTALGGQPKVASEQPKGAQKPEAPAKAQAPKPPYAGERFAKGDTVEYQDYDGKWHATEVTSDTTDEGQTGIWHPTMRMQPLWPPGAAPQRTQVSAEPAKLRRVAPDKNAIVTGKNPEQPVPANDLKPIVEFISGPNKGRQLRVTEQHGENIRGTWVEGGGWISTSIRNVRPVTNTPAQAPPSPQQTKNSTGRLVHDETTGGHVLTFNDDNGNPVQTPASPNADLDAKRAANKAKRDALMAGLRKDLGSQLTSGVDITHVKAMVGIVRTYIDDGLVEFERAWRLFQEEYADMAPLLQRHFEVAWKMLQGEDRRVADLGEPGDTTAGTDADGATETPLDGGRSPRSGDAGEPAGRPGDGSAPGVAGEQPVTAEGAQGQSDTSTGDRDGRTAGRPRRPRRGTKAAGAGDADPRGAGANAPGHVDTADLADDDDVAVAHARGQAPRHFVIDDTAALTTDSGWTQKLDDNLAALRLLKELEKAGRMATDAEQAVLARYIGWGHTNLAPVVDPRGLAAIKDPRHKQAREELELILTREELRRLGDSTINAHYSFRDLPRAMWSLVERLGFKGGTILEPAIGTGHFFGTMPAGIRTNKRTRLFGVDMEPVASGIARQLYQGAHIQTSPLQEARLPDNYFDLVISNVPFGAVPVFDPAFVSGDKQVMTRSVHNYFFGKALDQARPGGLIVFVTSRYTMDSQSDVVRKYIDDRADFLGAFRLPDQSFKKTAGTEVVTDVIVLQKREPGRHPRGKGWLKTEDVELTGKDRWQTADFRVNEYYVANPGMILGEQKATGKMARTSELQYNVEGTITPERLAAAVAEFPTGTYKPSKAPARKVAKDAPADTKQGSLVLDKGKLYIYDKGTLTPSTLKGKALERAKLFVPLRDAYQTVLDTMVQRGSDADLATAQATMRKAYDTFTKVFGYVNARENARIIDLDPNGSRILALEDVEWIKHEKGKPARLEFKGLAPIFTKRTVLPVEEPTSAATPRDALVQSLAWKGQVDIPYMSGLLGGTSEADIVTALGAEVYQDPATQQWLTAEEYLSGDVVTKMAAAEMAARSTSAFERNVTALQKVQPTHLSSEDFSAPLGATWVPTEIYEQFFKAHGADRQNFSVTLLNTPQRVRYHVEGGGRHDLKPDAVGLGEWAAQALNGELPTIKEKDSTGKEFVNPELTERYRQTLKQLREEWNAWWVSNTEVADKLTKIYNGMFNREAPRSFDGSNLVIPNANPEIQLRPWQKNVVWRALQAGNTLLAHAVGAGKTFAMIATAGEMKRLGLAQKPMIVVPNHLIEQWRRDFLTFYPGARLLVPNKNEFDKKNRQRLIARIANNDWDAVILPASQYLRIGVTVETLQAFITEQETQLLTEGANALDMSVEEFDQLVSEAAEGDKKAKQRLLGRGVEESTKDIVRALIRLRERMQKRLDQQAKDAPVEFEKLGVDALFIDEAHLFKNLYFSSSKNGIVGLRGSDAGRAMDMFLKVRLINQASNGRNVHFATGTPVSNAISELYTMFRYLAQPTLDRLGMAGFDSWANSYAEAASDMEPAAGGGYKERTRLRYWSNLRELSKMFRRFADVITTEDLVKSGILKLPTLKGGKPTVIALDPHPEMEAFMDSLKDRIETLKTGKVDPKDDNHLKITTEASLAAIDLRLVMEGAEDDPNGRLRTAAREIAARYTASAENKGAQVVFLDVGTPKGNAIPPLPADLTGGPAPPPAAVEETDAAENEDDDEAKDDLVDQEAEAEEAMAQIRSIGLDKNLYGELKRLLKEHGIPEREVAFIHQATTPAEQRRLFDAVNTGKIRVLMATTSKGGVGMNIQKRLVALHHLDVPWRPADMEQREGRILRQGNEYAEVEVLRYVTKKSFDEYRWGLLATKQGFIYKLLRGEVNTMEDIDPSQLDMQVAAALASGDPRTLQMLSLEREVKGLRARYTNWSRKRAGAQGDIERYGTTITRLSKKRDGMRKDAEAAREWEQAPTLTLLAEPGRYYGHQMRATPRVFNLKDADDRKALQAELEKILEVQNVGEDPFKIATAGPFSVNLTPGPNYPTTQDGKIVSYRHPSLSVYVPTDLVGSTAEYIPPPVRRELWSMPNFVRSLDSYLTSKRLEEMAATADAGARKYQEEVDAAAALIEKPFGQAEEMKAKEQKLYELRVALGVEKATSAPDERAIDIFARQILQHEEDKADPASVWVDVDKRKLRDQVTKRMAELRAEAAAREPQGDDEDGGGTADSRSETRASSVGPGRAKTRFPAQTVDLGSPANAPLVSSQPGALTTSTLKGIPFPELVELARELMGIPGVVKAFRKVGKLGEFAEHRGIRLHAELFKRGNEVELAEALAHEIGHLVDWLPHQTLKRGNLIGRLFSLRKFLKQTFTKPNGTAIENKAIREELIALSATWRPWDRSKASASFIVYRDSAKELYADALSVLLNNPGLLEQDAPTFFRAFMEGLDTKPEVKKAYFDLQDVLDGTPEEIIARRHARTMAMFRTGDTKALDLERLKRAERLQVLKDFWTRLRVQFLDKNTAFVSRFKRGQVPVHRDPRFLLSERNYLGSKLAAWVKRHIQPVYETLEAHDLDWHTFGAALFYERVLAGDRVELANPLGLGPKEVAEQRKQEIYDKLTAVQKRVLNDQITAFRAAVGVVLEDAYKAGLYTPAMYADMKKNPAYATYRVLDHLEDGVSAAVFKQVGTLKDIANVADSTLQKALVTMAAAEHNRAKREAVDALRTHFPDDVEAARTSTDRFRKPLEPKKGDERELVTFKEQGTETGVYVDRHIAASLNNDVIEANVIIKAFGLLNNAWFRPVFTSLNIGFQTFNVRRDFGRTWKAMPDMTLRTLLTRYRQASTLGRVRAFGLASDESSRARQWYRGMRGRPTNAPTQAELDAAEDLLQAEETGILSQTYNDLVAGRDTAATQIEETMAKMGIAGYGPTSPTHPLVAKVQAIAETIREVGDFIETLPKGAALYEFKDQAQQRINAGVGAVRQAQVSDIPADQRAFIRERVGTPDALAGGTRKEESNQLFLFSNVIAQGLRADVKTAVLDPTTRSGFWWKTIAIDFVPKILTFAALYGLAGLDDDDEGADDWVAKALRGVTEYDLTNYTVLPLWITEAGETWYLRLPGDDTGRLLSGLLWKGLQMFRDDKATLDVVSQVAAYALGQAPTVTPTVGVASDTFDVIVGRNPYDSYRNRFVFSDDEQAAGGLPKVKKFLAYEFQQVGSDVFWRFTANDRPRVARPGQVVFDLPVLGPVANRWVRVTSYGEVERLREVQASVGQEEARDRLAERDLVDEALRAMIEEGTQRRPPAALRQRARQIVQQLYADATPAERKRQETDVFQKLRWGLERGSADPLIDAVLRAQTNRQKIATLTAAEGGLLSKGELRTWLQRARARDVISREVYTEVLRELR